MTEWDEDCLKWRGHKIPTRGRYAHYCYEWDMLPVDIFCCEILCCCCYKSLWFRFLRGIMRWYHYRGEQ